MIAVPLSGGTGGGLDALGQASAITAATGGELLPPTAANAVAQALLDGIRAVDVPVAPTVTTCDPALTVGFSPATLTVPSGTDASFQETIGVREGTAPGTYGCAVDLRTNGVSAGYTQSITVRVPGQSASLRIGDVSVPEGDAGTTLATFAVSLDRAAAAPVTVRWSTSDGTATAPSDFVAASGELTFAPGDVSEDVVVAVNGEPHVEPDETFTVQLSDAVGAVIADGSGVGTIVDDDLAGSNGLSIGDVSVPEGDTGTRPATFTVTLDQESPEPVSVRWSTSNGTATAPSDFGAVSDVVVFAPGQVNLRVEVPVVGDTAVEPDETFTVQLSDAAGATIADGQGVGTIGNDDVEIPAALSVGDASTAESGAATFSVSLNRPASGPTSVRYATANGTAAAPGDFAAATGGLTFAAGETTKQVAVPTVSDTTDELTETFTVNLSAPMGATIADGQGTGTIQDDDPNGVFGCRATVLTLSANAPFTPCLNDTKQSTGINVNLGLLRIQAAAPRVTTQATNGTAQATAQVGTTKISTIGLTIELGAVNATAAASCAGAQPTYSGSSSIGAIKLNGIALPVGSQPVTIPLLLGTLKLNSTTTTATGVTQRAVDLQTLLGGVVLGEARTGVTSTPAHPNGNPCVK